MLANYNFFIQLACSLLLSANLWVYAQGGSSSKKSDTKPVSTSKSGNNLFPFAALQYEFVNVQFKFPRQSFFDNGYVPSLWGFSGGANYVLAHANDMFSFCPQAAIAGNIQFVPNGGIGYLIQLPVAVHGRLGAGATPFNNQRFGLAVGGGISTSYLNYPFKYQDITSGSIYNSKISSFFVTPQISFEILWRAGATVSAVQIHADLTPATSKWSPGRGIDPVPILLSTFGLKYIYYLN